MKKTLCLILLLALLCLPACNKNQLSQEETTKTDSTTEVVSECLSDETNDSGGAFLTTRKYRVRYYSVPYQFILIVGRDKYEEWYNEYNLDNPDDTNEMVIKKFIQYFDISKENFEKANLEFAKAISKGVICFPTMNPKDYADQETYEIYNADIIYSFDDDIINEYYSSNDYAFGMWIEYNEALEAGTYQTRTTDWIDIEEMEAEIIAKYGEAEIVTTETAEEITTETTEAETQIETSTESAVTEA